MTPQQYQKERKRRGSVIRVAKLLNVHTETIYKRERGAPGAPITKEAALAIKSLPKEKK